MVLRHLPGVSRPRDLNQAGVTVAAFIFYNKKDKQKKGRWYGKQSLRLGQLHRFIRNRNRLFIKKRWREVHLLNGITANVYFNWMPCDARNETHKKCTADSCAVLTRFMTHDSWRCNFFFKFENINNLKKKKKNKVVKPWLCNKIPYINNNIINMVAYICDYYILKIRYSRILIL